MSLTDNLRPFRKPVTSHNTTDVDIMSQIEHELGARPASLITEGPTFNLSQLEDAIRERPYANTLSENVKTLPNADDLGRITAGAINASHEEVAKALALLATELAENVAKIELLKKNAEESMQMCLDIAERARQKGKADAERIEAAHNRNNQVREMIVTMREKVEQF